MKSEDFAMIAAAIEQYRGCGSDLRAEWTSLVAHHDGLLDIARRSLQAMSSVSTRILGRRTASFTPFLIPNRVPHDVTQDPSTDPGAPRRWRRSLPRWRGA